jgi:uncharacterized membrane protein YhaH (DUF805 family)
MTGLGTLSAILVMALAVALVAFVYWLVVRVLRKAGYSGWWCLLMLVPFVNLIMIWVFAFAHWPRLGMGGTRRA